jgi:hypothetical protein
LVQTDQLFGENEKDSKLLKAMAMEARNFLESFSWCTRIQEAYFGDGVGGVVAIFLIHIVPSSEVVDD